MAHRKKDATRAFGVALKRFRVDKGLTQEGLALEAGTERSHISSLERGEKGPSIETVLRLARALDITAAELMEQVEKLYLGKKR